MSGGGLEVNTVGVAPTKKHGRSILRDEAGFLVAAAVRLVVVFGLLAVMINEAGQVVLARARVARAATVAAQVGADAYGARPNMAEAKRRALLAAEDVDGAVEVTSFDCDRRGACTAAATMEANTLVLRRVPFLRDLGVMHASDSRNRSPS